MNSKDGKHGEETKLKTLQGFALTYQNYKAHEDDIREKVARFGESARCLLQAA